MADEPIARRVPDPNENGNGHSSAPKPIDLVIRFHPVNRNVELIANIDDRVLCYGMLEMARTMIDDFYLKKDLAEASRIIPAAGPLPPFPRG